MRASRGWALAAVLGALLAWLLWSQFANAPEPGPAPSARGPVSAPGTASLSPAPPGMRKETSAAPQGPPTDGLVECEIHVTTFGNPGRDVGITAVWQAEAAGVGTGTVRVRVKARSFFGLDLQDAAIRNVRVDVPDPVPPRIDVRVPARDDPRLAEPVLLVVDEVTGKPLPDAVLEPASKAPAERPVPADAEGRIRVPRALAERLRTYAWLTQSGIVTERNHYPLTWTSLVGTECAAGSDWIEWDATGAMRVRLKPLLAADRPVPRRTVRILDEDGNPSEGRLVLVRYPSMEMLMQAPLPARTDASGTVDLIVPKVAAYDIWDGGCLVGTFVMSIESMPENERREVRVPKVVRVHVLVRGLAEPKPNVWLRGPDVESLEPDERTGWARINGVVVPGWKVFSRAEGTPVQVSDGLPCEMDVLVPRDKPVPLWVAGREAVIRADAPKTVEIDWTTLQPPRDEETHSVSWSLTREGLDEPNPAGPSATKTPPSVK